MNYLGITIGPISETMSYTSTPAGLWAASYIFSALTKNICINLHNRGYEILTLPKQAGQAGTSNDFFAKYDVKQDDQGIGQFHDRVYARKEDKSDIKESDIKDAIQAASSAIAEQIANALDSAVDEVEASLSQYLQCHYVIVDLNEGDKIAQTLANQLDALENCSNLICDVGNNPLIKMLLGEKNGSNEYLKKFIPFNRQLKIGNDKDFKVKDILYIATNGAAHDKQLDSVRVDKQKRYYAIVQADGDNMGNVINGIDDKNPGTLEEQEQRITAFSTKCMKYTSESTTQVEAYGGVMLYAGGDDLLFLAPLMSNDGQSNIFSLCETISEEAFHESFYGEQDNYGEKNPSISFGVSINYYKFPLYEAFIDARTLLFGVAKNFGEKNNVAIKLNKASGQTSSFVCCMETLRKKGIQSDTTQESNIILYDAIKDLVKETYSKENDDKNSLMHSLVYHIDKQKALFDEALKDEKLIANVFANAFDNDGQKAYASYIAKIKAIATQLKDSKKIIKTDDDVEVPNSLASVLVSVLRVAKFFVEGDAE